MMGTIPNLWLAVLALGGLAFVAIYAAIHAGWDKLTSIFRRDKRGDKEESCHTK